MKTGDLARARRHFELALQAKEEQVDAAVVNRRLEYLAALDEPARADLSGQRGRIMVIGFIAGAEDPATVPAQRRCLRLRIQPQRGGAE